MRAEGDTVRGAFAPVKFCSKSSTRSQTLIQSCPLPPSVLVPCSALVLWHVWYESTYSSTSWPNQKARHRRPRLGSPDVPPERDVLALAEHQRTQPAACGDAEPLRFALPAAIEEAATYQKRPAPGRVRASR